MYPPVVTPPPARKLIPRTAHANHVIGRGEDGDLGSAGESVAVAGLWAGHVSIPIAAPCVLPAQETSN